MLQLGIGKRLAWSRIGVRSLWVHPAGPRRRGLCWDRPEGPGPAAPSLPAGGSPHAEGEARQRLGTVGTGRGERRRSGGSISGLALIHQVPSRLPSGVRRRGGQGSAGARVRSPVLWDCVRGQVGRGFLSAGAGVPRVATQGVMRRGSPLRSRSFGQGRGCRGPAQSSSMTGKRAVGHSRGRPRRVAGLADLLAD